jgi:hypothetical protein
MNLITVDGRFYTGHSVIIRGDWVVIDGESVQKGFKEIKIKAGEKSTIFNSPRILSLSEKKNDK